MEVRPNVTPTRQSLSEEFVQLLRDINRNRVLILMLAPRQSSSNLTPGRAAILALLCELDSRQRGPWNKRLKASVIGEMLGMHPNDISPQIVQMSDQGLCTELSREAGQDKRVKYYVITDKGKNKLNLFLDEHYMLAEEIYHDVEMRRARYVLEFLRKQVSSRIAQRLRQIGR